MIARTKKEKSPKKTVMISCEVQMIQPNAVPASSGTWYSTSILEISGGKNPKPPLVKVITNPPITKATMVVPNVMFLVASKEYTVR